MLNVVLPTDVLSASLTIYNSLGQIVIQHQLNQNIAVSVDNLATGLYNYKIKSADRIKMGKLIKE